MAGGRPTDYTPDLGDMICAGIAKRVPLVRICEADELPDPRTVYRWLREHAEFCQNYVRAREDQADFIAEEVIEIADDPDIKADDKRIRVDARKWLSSKYKTKVYGDRVHTEHSGRIETTDLSDEELTRRLAELEQAKAQSER